MASESKTMLYKHFIRPFLFKGDPEEMHDSTLRLLEKVSTSKVALELLGGFCGYGAAVLEQKLFGLTFPNPVGLAAGFSKNGHGIPALAGLGFGFLELGGVTPLPQTGNPKPRMFRIPTDEGIVNRMGFNNDGAPALAEKLKSLSSRRPLVPIGINLGKGKETPLPKAIEDYKYSLLALYGLGDFFVVNVSSPNTANLRQLQDKVELAKILTELANVGRDQARFFGGKRKPILVKISPDLSDEAIGDVVQVVRDTDTSGIIATNTTTARFSLAPHTSETGGYSGDRLFHKMLRIATLIRNKDPRLPLIAVGGINSGERAVQCFQAGVNLIQIYTALVYEGPNVVFKIKKHVRREIDRGYLKPFRDMTVL